MLLRNNFTLKDSIVLCRYGLIFRGNKIRNAQIYGAQAVLLFDDPLNGTTNQENTYPNNIFMPKDGTQRGTVYMKEGQCKCLNLISLLLNFLTSHLRILR